jgi:hypothetical protein
MMMTARHSRGLRERLAFWALAGVALLLSHDAIFLAQVGPGEPLARLLRSGNHGYWQMASVLLVAGGLIAAGATGLRLRSLRRQADALGAKTLERSSRGYVPRVAASWVRLFAVVTVGFVIQEQVEHLVVHDHVIGTGALFGPDTPLALPVLGLITLLGALVAAALGGAADALAAVIVDTLRRLASRAPRQLIRPPLRLAVAPRSPLDGSSAGRAPPLRPVFGI